MSELYVSTSMGEYAMAAVMGSRRSFHQSPSARSLDGFFECFEKVKEDFPVQTLRKIFVDIGPGSFTGVKVGVTFARTLAQQLRLPLIALRSADIAAASAEPQETVSAILDTGNGFVYGALYPADSVYQDAGIYAVAIKDWLDYAQLVTDGKVRFCGLLSQRDEAILEKRNLKFSKLAVSDILENMILLAASEGRVSSSKAPGPQDLPEIVPIYISRQQAETEWQKKLEDEMITISQLAAKKEAVVEDIKNLEKMRREKEEEIEDIAQLSEKALDIRRELAAAMDELSILNAKRTAYNESIAAKEKKIEEYDRKLDSLKTSLRDCERELASRQAKYEKIKQLPPEIPREVELYIQQRDELKSEVENLLSEKENYSRQIEDLATSRFEEVFERIRKEEGMLEELSGKRRLKEEELRGLEEDIKEMRRRRAAAEEDRDKEESPAPVPPEESLTQDDEESPSESAEEPSVAAASDEEAPSPDEKIPEYAPVEEEQPSEEPAFSPEESLPAEVSESPPAEDEFSETDRELPLEPLVKKSVENLEYMIRPLGIKDLPAVMEIEEASSERPWRRQMFKEELAIPVSKLYTISGRWRRGDRMALMGYAVFWIVSEKAHIINFAVAPQERGKGIGSCLLFEILKKAAVQGCKSAYLEVRISAPAAHMMLEKAGFVKTAVRKDYFGYPKEDAFIYERKLQ